MYLVHSLDYVLRDSVASAIWIITSPRVQNSRVDKIWKGTLKAAKRTEILRIMLVKFMDNALASDKRKDIESLACFRKLSAWRCSANLGRWMLGWTVPLGCILCFYVSISTLLALALRDIEAIKNGFWPILGMELCTIKRQRVLEEDNEYAFYREHSGACISFHTSIQKRFQWMCFVLPSWKVKC